MFVCVCVCVWLMYEGALSISKTTSFESSLAIKHSYSYILVLLKPTNGKRCHHINSYWALRFLLAAPSYRWVQCSIVRLGCHSITSSRSILRPQVVLKLQMPWRKKKKMDPDLLPLLECITSSWGWNTESSLGQYEQKVLVLAAYWRPVPAVSVWLKRLGQVLQQRH